MLDVYHRYQQYRDLLGQEVAQTYLDDQCLDGCPPGSHCSYGLCFCDLGKGKVWKFRPTLFIDSAGFKSQLNI